MRSICTVRPTGLGVRQLIRSNIEDWLELQDRRAITGGVVRVKGRWSLR